MSNPSFSNPSIEEYVPKIKIVADEMARRKHGIENDIEINEMILRDMIEQLNKNSISKTNTKNTNKINTKNTKTKNRTSNSTEKIIPLKTNSNEPNDNENINSKLSQGNKSIEGINTKDGNSNIINTNTNLNTNQNTYSRLNTYYNINTNNNVNNNNDINNNLEIDENNEFNQSSQSNSNNINNSNNNEYDNLKNYENYLNKNKNIDENINSNYLNIQKNKYNKESINDEDETSENKEVRNKNENIEEETIYYSPSLEYSFEDSSDDTNISRSNYINNKSKKLTLYEREIRNREVRNKILEKKREQNKINEVKNLKPHPKMDKNSKKIINAQKNYVPIEERAAKIHSMKLAKQILIEEEKKYQKWKEEMDAIYIRKMRTKNFDKEEWDEFVKSQYQWKDEVQYKIRAAQIFRKNVYKKYFFKPNISKKSKSIIKDLQKGNDSFIDEVFVRLFNDYEERKERQKFINENSLPSFKPKISKNSSQKLLYRNEKIPNRCNSNSVMSISKINNSKNDYRNDIYNNFNKNKTRNKNQNNNIPKTKSQNIINEINININNNDKKSLNNKSYSVIKDNNEKNYLYTNNSFISKNRNNKCNKKQIENKSQGPTQPTNNTNANNYNHTEMTNDIISSKYIILENPLVRSFINKNIDKSNSQIKLKPVVPTLPIKEKNTIENNCEESNDSKAQNIYGISQERQSYFAQSHYDDDEEIKKNKIEKNENEENECDDYYNVYINQNDEESTNKKLPNESLQNSNTFEKIESMNNIDKARKYGRQTQNETLNSDDSKLGDNNLYRLNIRESTPLMIKQDVILPSNEYSDFFNKSEK